MLCGPYSWKEIPAAADTRRTGAPKKKRLKNSKFKIIATYVSSVRLEKCLR